MIPEHIKSATQVCGCPKLGAGPQNCYLPAADAQDDPSMALRFIYVTLSKLVI